MPQTRRGFLAATTATALLAALPARAEKASLSELSAYLNTIGTVETRFTQINSDGSKSTGRLFIKRPGRARFEYDPPLDDTLVLAGGGSIGIFDGRGTAEVYPLATTPLKLILDRNIDLTRIHMVTGHGEQDGRTVVQAQDPEHPEYGRIYLFFDRNPMRLSEWLIVSQTGEQTRLKLRPFVEHDRLSDRMFSVRLEKEARG
ncbi:outer membrane lipoprotein carrier protein LolA [Fluviibacterium sp. DFM31]|uniref:Outer membrane lipoprotein carrier protein LolA n=1 Tax=Meridianimarinicoccus marinus TaxID=3231483 RepID=A0ABV3L8M0_9RHOB